MTIQYPVYKPYLCGNEKEYVNACLDSGWISSQGPFVEKFEQAFARYLGVNHALSCSNGTTALHLALLALGIEAGDEVIVPALTYVATANAVSYVGATPVFVDAEPHYFQIDPDTLEQQITSKTRAIIVVHLYGHSVDMKQIMHIAEKHHLYVIEDCAEAIGTAYQEQLVGTFGDIATFSFFGNKTITTGEGGMVVTNHQALADRVFKFKGQGVSKTSNYYHDVIGYNYRMTNICCAIGLAQLEHISSILDTKIKIGRLYKELLKETSDVFFHEQKGGTRHTYWLVSIVIGDMFSRDGLIAYLFQQGIDSRPFFKPMHQLPIHQRDIVLPVSERLSSQGISLPSYPELSETDILYITSHILKYLQA